MYLVVLFLQTSEGFLVLHLLLHLLLFPPLLFPPFGLPLFGLMFVVVEIRVLTLTDGQVQS